MQTLECVWMQRCEDLEQMHYCKIRMGQRDICKPNFCTFIPYSDTTLIYSIFCSPNENDEPSFRPQMVANMHDFNFERGMMPWPCQHPVDGQYTIQRKGPRSTCWGQFFFKINILNLDWTMGKKETYWMKFNSIFIWLLVTTRAQTHQVEGGWISDTQGHWLNDKAIENSIFQKRTKGIHTKTWHYKYFYF